MSEQDKHDIHFAFKVMVVMFVLGFATGGLVFG